MWEQLFLDQNIIGNMMATRIEGVHNFQSDPRHYVSIPPPPAPGPRHTKCRFHFRSPISVIFIITTGDAKMKNQYQIYSAQ